MVTHSKIYASLKVPRPPPDTFPMNIPKRLVRLAQLTDSACPILYFSRQPAERLNITADRWRLEICSSELDLGQLFLNISEAQVPRCMKATQYRIWANRRSERHPWKIFPTSAPKKWRGLLTLWDMPKRVPFPSHPNHLKWCVKSLVSFH